MPTQENGQWARRRLNSRTAILAALIALAIGAPPAGAATAPGQLYAFGYNYYGQLGSATNNGTGNPSPTPALVSLPGASGPVTQVAAGYEHSLALTSSGQLYAFGSNYHGQLGSAANEIPNPTPALVSLPGASSPVAQVAGGGEHSLALTSTGQLYAFGYNEFGQLGQRHQQRHQQPEPDPGPGQPAGGERPGGADRRRLEPQPGGDLERLSFYAFGSNSYGQLGNATNSGTIEPNPTPALVSLPGASGPVVQVGGGGDHSLAVTSSGQLYAFGENRYGQLGSATNNGTGNPNPTPALVSLPVASGPVAQVAGGGNHSLAVTSSRAALRLRLQQLRRSWAAKRNENPNPTPTPVSLPGQAGRRLQITAGYLHSLALTSSGQLYAFGRNRYGQLGSATNSGTNNPNPVPALVGLPAGTTIDTMASGAEADHTLVVIANLAVTSNSLPSGRGSAPPTAPAPQQWAAPPPMPGRPAGCRPDSRSMLAGRSAAPRRRRVRPWCSWTSATGSGSRREAWRLR